MEVRLEHANRSVSDVEAAPFLMTAFPELALRARSRAGG